jgi:hypothetical protein
VQLKQSTIRARVFDMGDAGLTVSVSISKAGSAFAAATGTVAEISDGCYKITLSAADTNTLGDLAFRCTSAEDGFYTFWTDDVVTNTVSETYTAAAAAPTAIQNADALLARNMASVTGAAARSPLNALRALRNKVEISSTGKTITVYAEDDATSAWTGVVSTDAGLSPITSVDPA